MTTLAARKHTRIAALSDRHLDELLQRRIQRNDRAAHLAAIFTSRDQMARYEATWAVNPKKETPCD